MYLTKIKKKKKKKKKKKNEIATFVARQLTRLKIFNSNAAHANSHDNSQMWPFARFRLCFRLRMIIILSLPRLVTHVSGILYIYIYISAVLGPGIFGQTMRATYVRRPETFRREHFTRSPAHTPSKYGRKQRVRWYIYIKYIWSR